MASQPRAARSRHWLPLLWFAALVVPLSAIARAQDANNTPPPAPPTAPADAQPNPAPAPRVQTLPYAPFLPAPGTELEGHLPSSSRAKSDINSGDTFDLGRDSSAPVKTLRGRADAPGILPGPSSETETGRPTQSIHTVKKGDTLWDICALHFNNPWSWPELWSYNPQVQNPHWIYPGDQVRLTSSGSDPSLRVGAAPGIDSALISRRALVPKDTVFLRQRGYIDDPDRDVWGELVGAREEYQLLSQGNTAYVILREGVQPEIGQELSIFRVVRDPPSVPGARKPSGKLVAIQGTFKVESWDGEHRVASGMVSESLDIIERGAKVGPVARRFDVVPPVPSRVELVTRVLTSIYPHEFVGGEQLVFVDRGSKDGLAPGNRLFIIRQGDAWRGTLETTVEAARTRVLTDVPEPAKVELTPLIGDESTFPLHVIGELRVLRAHPESSLAVVTSAQREIEPGDRALAVKGK